MLDKLMFLVIINQIDEHENKKYNNNNNRLINKPKYIVPESQNVFP